MMGRVPSLRYGNYWIPSTLGETERLLPSEDAIHPALLVGTHRVQGRESLRQLPEGRLVSDAFFDKESFQGFGSASAKKEHRLVNAIERGRTCPWRSEIAPVLLLSFGNYFFEQRELLALATLLRRSVLRTADRSEKVPTSFRSGKQTRFVTLHFNNVTQFGEICSETLCNLASSVKF
jgi:hypothetical protein